MRQIRIQLYALITLLSIANETWGQQPPTSGTHKFTSTTTLTKTTALTGDLTIDLNGYTVTCPYHAHTFTVGAGCTLTIKDSQGGGKFVGHSNGGGDRGGFMYLEGTFNLEGGTISGFKTYETFGETRVPHIPTQGSGGAVYINDGGTFNMKGGSIEYCHTGDISKTYTVESTEYSVVCVGGAVFIDAENDKKSAFNFSGGTIQNCTAGTGGAVYVHAPLKTEGGNAGSGTANFKMSGDAKIINCEAKYKNTSGDYGGGGVMVATSDYGKGIFDFSENALIEGCKTLGQGCGVLLHGDMTMYGGTINNCRPMDTGDQDSDKWSVAEYPKRYSEGIHGGGIYTYNGAEFTMNAGTISNNIAASGGGIMVYGMSNSTNKPIPSTFTMNGGSLTGNLALGSGGLGNGGAVYVQASIFKFNAGTLSENKANRYGGGINLNNSAELHLSGACIISGNTASHGGGISQESGECNMELAHSEIEIIDNTANGTHLTTETVGGVEKPIPGQEQNQGNGGGLFIEKGKLEIKDGLISGNRATGSGGGVAVHLERIAGDATVNISGGKIQGNVAEKVNGGGVSLLAKIDKTVNETTDNTNDIVVNFTNGTLFNNKAVNGGGIYIDINDKATANMTIGTESDIPQISGNKAEANGGALGLSNGTMNIVNGVFTDNHAAFDNTTGNGGAVYLGGGTFKVTGNATISKNSAINGGGICVENGVVQIESGTIEENISELYGGGLYVFGKDKKDIVFSGGAELKKNTAKHGGGVCVDGPLTLKIQATIDSNTADNGGGVCLQNGAEMIFGKGLIRSNQAIGKAESMGTAYLGTTETLHGVGGGIFLDSKTSLKFETSETSAIGLYNNKAENAADDIFANGNGTSVDLPAVNSMKLDGFDVATTYLYWIEDYVSQITGTGTEQTITGDTYYSQGSNMSSNGTDGSIDKNVYRYRYAIENFKKLWELDDKNLDQYTNKYLCLALGYEQAYLKLIKSGLQEGDNIALLISFKGKGDAEDYTVYRKVYMYGIKDGKNVESTVILPIGDWKVEETSWSSKYNAPTFSSGKKTLTNGTNSTIITILKNQLNELTITNTLKESFENVDVRDAEYHKINRMKP